MTGKEYIALRSKFIEAAAWIILQSTKAHRSPDDLNDIIQKTVTRLGDELRQEVEKEVKTEILA